MDDRIIILPIADTWTYIGITIFFLFLGFLVIIGFFHVKKSTSKTMRWQIMLDFLNRHDLVLKDIALIKQLYQSRDQKTQEEILTNKKLFHKIIYESFIQNITLDAPDKVNILEKLFPTSKKRKDIDSLDDLVVGENCAVLSGNDQFLGSLVKKNETDLMISIDNFDPVEITTGNIAGIYFFRPYIGGFQLSGSIREIGPDFILFRFNGTIIQKSGHHLMAEFDAPVIFRPSPLPDKNTPAYRHEITGVGKIFSDRAIVFKAKNDEDVPYYLNHHEIWSLSVKLPEGYVFTCRGSIVPSTLYEKSYIFRFFDASETGRNILYMEIQNHNPVKEKIT